jgi:hypothetical protein
MDNLKLVNLQHPAGKSAGKIRHSDYLALCDFVIATIRQVKTISLISLIDLVEKHFKEQNLLNGDFRWMTLAVKLNLEAQGKITTVYPKGRQRSRPLLRLKYSRARHAQNTESRVNADYKDKDKLKNEITISAEKTQDQ